MACMGVLNRYWSGIRLLTFFLNLLAHPWSRVPCSRRSMPAVSEVQSSATAVGAAKLGPCVGSACKIFLISTFVLIYRGSDGQTVKSDRDDEKKSHSLPGLMINTVANICNVQASVCYLLFILIHVFPSNSFFSIEQWASRRRMVKGGWPCKGPFGLKDPSGWQNNFTKV